MSSEDRTQDTTKLPALQRPREPREPLVDPGKIRLIIVVVTGILLIAGSLTTYALTGRSAIVPDIVGLTQDIASRQLEHRHLRLEIGQRLYSTQPKGTVLDQSPSSGRRVSAGSKITVSVSGGTDKVISPDLSGMTRSEALRILREAGLLACEISQASPEKAGTVISTSPAAGTRLQIGETVILHVARATDTITLVDLDLKDRTIVIEPLYCEKLPATDVSYDVAQRLSALVQAAGGNAIITRASTETMVDPAELDRRASEAHPVALIRIMVDGSDSSALTVMARQEDGSLGQALFKELKWVSSTALFSNTQIESAALLSRSAVVSLGQSGSAGDRALLTDPLFRDNVARALYLGLGKTLAP